MAIRREDPAAVGVVEKHEPAGDGVVIGGDVGTEHAQLRAPVPPRQVAENLIVGAVLLDDVDDMLDETRLPDPLGHRSRRRVGAGREKRFPDRR